jgi:precorrin-2/cobalt-factor-2 C20-methyltransferase
MSGCWSVAGMPIVQGDDVLSVLPGTMAEGELQRRLSDTQAAVIMKVGRNLPKIRRALEASGRLCEAVYVERGTMANARWSSLPTGRWRGAVFLAGACAGLGEQSMSGGCS